MKKIILNLRDDAMTRFKLVVRITDVIQGSTNRPFREPRRLPPPQVLDDQGLIHVVIHQKYIFIYCLLATWDIEII